MAHELVSPHCSSWSFSFSGGSAAAAAVATRGKFDAASTVTANPVDDGDSNSDYYELELSPTPSTSDLQDDDRSRRSGALLVNYFAAGVFHGVVPALVYPLFKVHLGLQGYQANAAQTLLGCAWHGKIFLCLLTDCVPICGRRRTPYLYVGWTFVLAIFGMMLVLHPDDSEKGETSDAPRLILAIATASVGYLMVDAACDGLMVETVHRDSQIEELSSFRVTSLSQSAVHAARFVAELLGTLAVGVGMNSETYGGIFPFALSVRTLLTGLMALALLAIVATMWGLREPRFASDTRGSVLNAKQETISNTGGLSDPVMTYSSMPPLRARLAEFWRIMQQRATWQIASFGFLQKACLSFGMDSAPHSQAIHEFWLDTDPFTKNVFLAFASGGVCVAASIFVHRCLLSASWHSTVLSALLTGLVIGFPVAMAVVFNTCRSKFLFLGATEIVGFADCVAMVVRMLVVVEIAEPGFESSTYGLVTSVYNLADPVTTAVGNILGVKFRVYDIDMKQDTREVRMRAGALFAVLFSVRALVGLGTLPLLPRQKLDARELKARGGSSKRMALLLFSVIGIAFVAGLTSNFFAIFQSTSCLSFSGGAGC